MDTALVLKQKVDSGIITTFHGAQVYLNNSDILGTLLGDFDIDAPNVLNRLSEISEIPFAFQLEKVQRWTNTLAELSFCGDGFSLTGKSDDILSCYNSMITRVLLRMNYSGTARIQKGIEWIMKYQNFERGVKNTWPGSRIAKYGGCLKSTPCYIGVVKATLALSDYQKFSGIPIEKPCFSSHRVNKIDSLGTVSVDKVITKEGSGVSGDSSPLEVLTLQSHSPSRLTPSIQAKLNQGLEYILDHQIYLRKSTDQRITNDILTLTYPFSYKTNIIEILRLLKDNNLDSDPRCDSAKAYLMKKRRKDGYWRVNSSYLPKFWIPFDKPREPGLWMSHEIEKILK